MQCAGVSTVADPDAEDECEENGKSLKEFHADTFSAVGL
jgi:hypothetical protein